MTEILVVDDSEFDNAFVKQVFRGIKRIRDWNAEYVSSGEEALARLKERQFDIVLTDFHMPEMTGLELMDRVKEENFDIPVVIMTSGGSEELVLKALRNGAANYVIKKQLERDLPTIIEKMTWLPEVNGQTRLY